MKKEICLGLVFISIFLFSVSSAFAYCSMPAAYRENGAGLDTISGIKERRLVSIDQADYPGASWISYNLQIKNKNTNQNLLVYLEPETSQNNINPSSMILAPNEKGNLTLQVWVRQSKDVVFRLRGVCGDGTRFDDYIKPEVEVEVQSSENTPPQSGCSLPISGCDLNNGLFTSYYCDGSETKSAAICVDSCCKAYGQQFEDEEAFCSIDRHSCISAAGIEPTEGKIAFLCGKDDCASEKDIMLTFRLMGWGVDGRNYKSWSESDFDSYDIIACYQQSACKTVFNSPAYNQHIVNRKPFLEISSSRSASAAYEFGYINKSSGSSGKDMFFVTSQDELASGYNNYVNVVSQTRPSFAVVKDKYLDKINNPELTDLADSGYNTEDGGSIFFKVDNTVGHGRYAFIGWLTRYQRGQLNADGEIILRRTMSWLKNTDPIGERKKVAFLCSKDLCSDKDERDLIKLFRKWGFYVTGKAMKSWGSEVSDYDLIVCRNSLPSCNIPLTSPVYTAHIDNDVPFLEIPETSKAYAAGVFGYVTAAVKRMSSDSLQPSEQHPIIGSTDVVQIFPKRRPLSGIEETLLTNVDDIANIFYISGTTVPKSTLFITDSDGGYAFIGWLGRSNIKYMTENAKGILHRTLNWLICGAVNC